MNTNDEANIHSGYFKRTNELNDDPLSEIVII